MEKIWGENNNYFEKVGGSSYRGFKLPTVKLLVICMTEIQAREIDFDSSYREVRVSEGASYRESTVFTNLQKFYVVFFG